MDNRIIESALSSLGRGFDLTSDLTLEYCKTEERLVVLNEADKRDIILPCFGAIKDVSIDIRCDEGDQARYQSGILDFNQMKEFLNEKLSISSKIPSRSLNATFSIQRDLWATDAASGKNFGVDGYFFVLFNVHIDPYLLDLSCEVRNAVPSTSNPSALARFIQKYGTHVIVGLSVRGQDVVLVKRDKSTNLWPSELERYLHDLGDQHFTGTSSFSQEIEEQKYKGISVVFSRRGGDPSVSSHSEWLQTVSSNPDVLHFNFIPITSLLKRVPGTAFLSHAINLYLTCKPPTADLQHFLAFQIPKIWSPVHNDFPSGPTTNNSTPSPTLHFSFIGPKLHVNTIQVTAGKRPVTGMRLYLEGRKCNRLAIRLQHLSKTPTMLEDKIDDTLLWQGSDKYDAKYFHMFVEPIHYRNYSHICTAPVKYDPEWTAEKDDVSFIVTGVQLHIQNHESKSVLHLRLSFSRIKDSSIRQSSWATGSIDFSRRHGFLSGISTSLMSDPDPLFEQQKPDEVDSIGEKRKFLKFVDTSELCKGAMDSPGYWLITGARLHLEQGKIGLQVKFSLLNIWS